MFCRILHSGAFSVACWSHCMKNNDISTLHSFYSTKKQMVISGRLSGFWDGIQFILIPTYQSQKMVFVSVNGLLQGFSSLLTAL